MPISLNVRVRMRAPAHFERMCTRTHARTHCRHRAIKRTCTHVHARARTHGHTHCVSLCLNRGAPSLSPQRSFLPLGAPHVAGSPSPRLSPVSAQSVTPSSAC